MAPTVPRAVAAVRNYVAHVAQDLDSDGTTVGEIERDTGEGAGGVVGELESAVVIGVAD